MNVRGEGSHALLLIAKVKIFSEARANAAALSSTALAYGNATVAAAIGKILNFIVDMG